MPTYDYKCKKCEGEFEKFQSMKDDTIPCCPVCGGQSDKLISGGNGIIFNGSGFYSTDYGGHSSTKKYNNNGKSSG